MTVALTLTEIDASREGRDALESFYRRLYVAEFPDPDERESLANMARYLALKARGWYGPNNYHVLIMEHDGEAIGGSVSDYLAKPNTGVIEFLFTRASDRARGHGSALLDATVRTLARDARVGTSKPLTAVVAEMNDPFCRPRTPDNMDPFERAAIWGQWGFSKLAFPYVQPALSRGQSPVPGLALVAKLLRKPNATAVAAGWLAGVVREYMHWAMRIRQPSRNTEYRAMARYLAAHPKVPMIPLRDYVGRNVAKALAIEEIDVGDCSFPPMMALLQRELPFSGRTASAEDFERALARRGTGAYQYHLWRLASPASKGVHGLASFFTLAHSGFGGYVVFGRRLRGRKLLRPLIARIEERMIKDATRAEGWLIECDETTTAVFTTVGFRELPVDYRPPRVGAAADVGEPERLKLLYKPFGSVNRKALPGLPFVLDCVGDILRHVYGVRSPRAHECYRRVLRSSRLPTRKEP